MPGVQLERRLPGRADRRPHPGQGRQLRQRQDRPEQGRDRSSRRDLPDREGRTGRRWPTSRTASSGGPQGGSNLKLIGPVTARSFRSDGTRNILVDGWRVDCGGCDGEQIFHLEDAQSSTVRNSNIGNNKNNSLIWISGSNITFDHNVIHDAGLPDGSSAHTECMYAWRVTNLTLRRNHFYHCAVMDVFITGGDVSTGGLVENNVFERPWENTGRVSNWGLRLPLQERR